MPTGPYPSATAGGSFTYNLVQYLGELGAAVEVVRNDQITLEEIRELNPER
ncbi:MAG: anthranilate/aminodeoxychorismate synthase component II, partial [Chloroflexota bacterium]